MNGRFYGRSKLVFSGYTTVNFNLLWYSACFKVSDPVLDYKSLWVFFVWFQKFQIVKIFTVIRHMTPRFVLKDTLIGPVALLIGLLLFN